MKIFFRITLLVVCCLSLGSLGFAQTDRAASATHVFPQIADGKAADGTYYKTTIIVTNVNNSAATCMVTLYGLSTSRLSGGINTANLPGGGSFTYFQTTGLDALASGYATLTCSKAVTAFTVYEYHHPISGLAAMATVFSSQSSSLAHYAVDQRLNTRFAFAVANDSTSAGVYQVAVFNAAGVEVGRTNVSLAAKSNRAVFLDELFQLPPSFLGTAVVASTSLAAPSGPSFSTIGLLFGCCSPLFTTMPATVFLP